MSFDLGPEQIEMERQPMKAIVKAVLVLVGCVSLDPALAQPPKASTEDSSVAKIIEQRVRDWGNALIAVDADKMSTIIADDWIDGYPGKTKTKADYLAALKSGTWKLEACEFGPMEVKVLGDVAVIQGSANETMIKDGKSSTYWIAFMDVFVKRGDKWVAVRSQARKL